MEIKASDIVSLFQKAMSGSDSENLNEIGFVVQVGDNFCKVHGLQNAVLGELVNFDGGNSGIIMNLDEDFASIFLLKTQISVAELEIVRRSGGVFKIPTGECLLGRVINGIGETIDFLDELKPTEFRPIESYIPSIIERTPINESLETGILAIDSLVPVGKGQRELIIGNRSTGKTSIVTDIILNQKNKNVCCVYVSIGQRQSSLARMINILSENGAMEYTTIISADAGESALERYLAPYVGCTVAEYFKDQAKDVLIIYDDLSSHAVAYREMSLLMRRAPGREAYPGDVFYLHSRLLERAGKFKSGGSITALPIVQIQSDDITAYIPTNLISITDGQIFLDTKLFNNGIRPAVNVELSVSRVASAAQTNAMKSVCRGLRLDLAQYQDLLSFAQFGTELDIISQKKLKRGSLIVEVLKQPQHLNYTLADEVIILFLIKENLLDNVKKQDIQKFLSQFLSYVKSVYNETYSKINEQKKIEQDITNKLMAISKEFLDLFLTN